MKYCFLVRKAFGLSFLKTILDHTLCFYFLWNKKIIIEKTKLTKYRITGTPGKILKKWGADQFL